MIRRWLLLLLIALLLPAPAWAAEILTLGVLSYRPKDVMQRTWQPLADYLTQAVPGHEVRLRVLNPAEMEGALQRHELDFVFTNPAHYINLRSGNLLSGALATLVRAEQGHIVPAIGGVMIVREDRADITQLRDLYGKRVATPAPSYLGGFVSQAYEIVDAGLDLGRIRFESSAQLHDRIVDAVLKGEVDAGFVRTGVLEDLAREGRTEIAQLRILNRQTLPGFPYALSTRLYPEWPLVALPQVNSETARLIAARLLSLEADDPAAIAAGIHGFAIPADYGPVESAMRSLRAPPFDQVPDFTWRDVLDRYQPVAISLVGTGGIILVLAIGLMRRNRQLDTSNRQARHLAVAMKLERERLDNVISATQVGTWEWTIPTGELRINARWAEILGYTPDELAPVSIETWRRLAHPDDQAAIQGKLQAHFDGELPGFRHDTRMRHKSGSWVWVHTCGSVITCTRDGSPLLMAGTHEDITERKLAEDALRLSASVFQNSYEAILITDADNRIVDVNPSFTRITGYAREDVLGQNPSILSSGRQSREFYAQLWRSLQTTDHWRGEVWNRRKNGELFAESLSITRVLDSNGRLIHHVAVVSDISRLKAHAEELDRIAHFDPLTGVPNRRLLEDRLRQAIAHADRSRKPLAVCLLDLDGFKPINDQYGHEAGDQLLVEIVDRLQSMLRSVDTVARLGGDEFVLLLGDLESHGVFDRILEAVSQPVQLRDDSVAVSASIGVALYPEDPVDADTLLRHADQAMYLAKQRGRNCVQVFDASVEASLRQKQELLRRLAQALEQGEFVLHFQPKVDMLERRPVGAEALLRWNHPEEGLRPPADFLPALEGNELEIALGEWVIRTALEQVASWRAAGLDLPVAVNISARHLLKANFVADLKAMLDEHPDITPDRLELEIVESTAITDMNAALEVLTACRALGVQLALDDFGTGYASLAYFRRLPVDLLKIDRSFVRDMLSDADDRAIVLSVVHLAQAFDRRVIAEGVETTDHAQALIEIGCRLGQGYGIARPMPAAHIPGWIAWYSATDDAAAGRG